MAQSETEGTTSNGRRTFSDRYLSLSLFTSKHACGVSACSVALCLTFTQLSG